MPFIGIKPEICRQIFSKLTQIEKDHDVRIILAVESGSRAWGFASTDSDYDVRFIYVRSPDAYLSIDVEHDRDVIELPIEGELDINGWDLRKALKLLRKSNPSLHEWFLSPHVYYAHESANVLREIQSQFYSPRAAFYHYLHMAFGNLREYLQGDVVWRKKYFYVLRPVLACKWIERGLGPVPMEFDQLVARVLEGEPVYGCVAQLLEDKIKGTEMGRGPRIPELSDWLESELKRLEGLAIHVGDGERPDGELLDTAFRSVLQKVWKFSSVVSAG